MIYQSCDMIIYILIVMEIKKLRHCFVYDFDSLLAYDALYKISVWLMILILNYNLPTNTIIYIHIYHRIIICSWHICINILSARTFLSAYKLFEIFKMSFATRLFYSLNYSAAPIGRVARHMNTWWSSFALLNLNLMMRQYNITISTNYI